MKTTLTLASLSLVATAVATVALVQNAEGRKETRALKASLVAVLNSPPPPVPPEPPIEVADTMTKLQRHANKLYFAGRHENWKLADFYIEEIEETAKDFSKKDVMHGQVNISGLMDALIQPEILELERAASTGNGPDFQQHYNALIKNCNACHTAVNLPWIVVQEPRTPAYDNQSYERVIAPATGTSAPAGAPSTVFVEPLKPQ